MRTIAIVFALTVVGATAPTAWYGLGHLSTALLAFTAALVIFLAACLVSGWLLSELGTLMRTASGGPAGGAPTPVARSASRLARFSLVGHPRPVARAPHASASGSAPSYPVPIQR